MKRGTFGFAATVAVSAALYGQGPAPEFDPQPTAGLGGGPSAAPKEYAAFARTVVAFETARLRDPDPAVRRAACARLGQLAGHGHEATSRLMDALADADRGVMLAAASALASIVGREDEESLLALERLAGSEPHPSARGAVEALSLMRLRRATTAEILTDLLEHPDYDFRMAALQGLTATASVAARGVRTLGVLVADAAEPEEIRIAAAECLRRFGDAGLVAAQDVVRALPDLRVGSAAARVLHDLGLAAAPWRRYLELSYDAKATTLAQFDRQFELARALDATSPSKIVVEGFLRAMLAHKDPSLRDEAVFRIGQEGSKFRPMAPALIVVLKSDPEPRVRARAAAALGLVGDLGAAAIDALLEALRDPAARFDAALSLGLNAPDLADTVGALASRPGLPPEDRAAILFAAARVSAASAPHVRRLAELLRHEDPMTRGAALVFFGVMRKAPLSADVDLARGLVDPILEIRETARWTVARCYPMGAHGRTLDSLRAVSEAGLLPYWLAASTWWSLTPDDWEMISALGDLRHRARFGLARGRPLAPEPDPVGDSEEEVRRAAVDPDARVRELAALKAAALGPAVRGATPLLRRLLVDPSRRVRVAAADAFAAMGSTAGATVPDVLRLLDDPCWSVRRAGVRALERLRVDPSVLRPALARRKADAIPRVREAATQALVALASGGAAPNEGARPPSVK